MPGCIVSATTASFRSVEKRRRRATPVITSTFENVSDIGVCLGLSLGPPAIAGVRSKRGAVHQDMLDSVRAGDILLADRAYDSDALRQNLAERGAWANIKPMPRRTNIPAFSPFLYRYRN